MNPQGPVDCVSIAAAGVWRSIIESSVGRIDLPDHGEEREVTEEPTDEPMCPVCFDTDPEGMIQLDCKHSLHLHCIEGMVKAGWTGKRVTFTFMSCPECRSPMSHPAISNLLKPHRELQEKVLKISLQACLNEGVIEGLKELVETDEDAALDAAANEMSCFICSLCNKPYVGGRKDCAGLDRMDASQAICTSCQWKRPSAYKCATHGLDDAMIKCDWCCNIATFKCGPGHFCNECHKPPYAHTLPLHDRRKGGKRKTGQGEVCPGPGKCPLQIPHPPNGQGHTAFVVGCLHGCTNHNIAKANTTMPEIKRTESFMAEAAGIVSHHLEDIGLSHGIGKKPRGGACCVVM